MTLFCSRIPLRTPKSIYVAVSCLHRLLWLWHLLRPSLLLMTLEVLGRTSQIFCRISLSLDLSVFMIRLGLCVFRRKDTEVKCCSHHITLRIQLSMWLLSVINLDHLAEGVFVRLCHPEGSNFLPSSQPVLLKGSPHLRMRNYDLPLAGKVST